MNPRGGDGFAGTKAVAFVRGGVDGGSVPAACRLLNRRLRWRPLRSHRRRSPRSISTADAPSVIVSASSFDGEFVRMPPPRRPHPPRRCKSWHQTFITRRQRRLNNGHNRAPCCGSLRLHPTTLELREKRAWVVRECRLARGGMRGGLLPRKPPKKPPFSTL